MPRIMIALLSLTFAAGCARSTGEPAAPESAPASPPASTSAAGAPSEGTAPGAEAAAEAPSAPATPTPEAAPAAVAPSGPTDEELAALSPCFLSAEAISAALGKAFAAGRPLPPIGSIPTRSCTYEAGDGGSSFRVNVSWLSPASVDSIRSTLGMGLAAEATPVAGDADGAVFQLQHDLNTCALHYVRNGRQYELRLLSCPEGAAAQSMFLALPRP